MIPQELIEKALQLTEKSMEDMKEIVWWKFDDSWYVFNYKNEFSYPKFFYYLLSPEFIEKYNLLRNVDYNFLGRFWEEIYEYQSWNPEPIIYLLSKI